MGDGELADLRSEQWSGDAGGDAQGDLHAAPNLHGDGDRSAHGNTHAHLDGDGGKRCDEDADAFTHTTTGGDQHENAHRQPGDSHADADRDLDAHASTDGELGGVKCQVSSARWSVSSIHQTSCTFKRWNVETLFRRGDPTQHEVASWPGQIGP